MFLRRFIILPVIGVFCLVSAAFASQDGQGGVRLSLAQALQRVDTVNFQVVMANARVEEAIARIAQAEAALLPHLDGDVRGGRQTSDLRAQGIQFPGLAAHIGPYNTFDARIRVTVDLFDPSAFERFQAAKKGESLSKAGLEKTREDILALTASLFIEAQRKEQTAGLLKTLLDRDQMAYALSQDGLAQGTGTLLDTNKFKSDLDQTQYIYSQALHQAKNACLDLEAALQLPLDASVEFIDDKDFTAILENAARVDFKQAPNPDMALAASQLEARRADQKTAYADFLPKVSGSADYGRLGQSPGHGSNTYTVGLKISVPIWEGGLQQANLREVKGEIKEAQANLSDAAQQEELNIAKAQDAMLEAENLMQSKTQQRATAQKALNIALHAQEVGSGTALELIKAKADLAIAQDDYNEAQAAWLMAQIDLLHAQGRLRELIKKG